MLFTGLLPRICLAGFLIELRTTSLGMAPAQLITNLENALQLDLMEAFSQLVIKGERPLVGGAISGLAVLGSIREHAEQARGGKLVRNIPP